MDIENHGSRTKPFSVDGVLYQYKNILALKLDLKDKKLPRILTLTLMVSTLFSCSTIPKGAVAVQSFDKAKYLGRWYELARMDFRFERGLNNTTANYSLNKNGSIKVVNRGF